MGNHTDKQLAVSINMDGVGAMLSLHGLSGSLLTDHARAAVPTRAAERFGTLCAALGIRGTVFVAGQELAEERGTDAVLALHQAGHELACHGYRHDQALYRRGLPEIDDDLERAETALQALTGRRPVGFRAPGHNLSPRLEELLRLRGYLYDSSLLASPVHYAAKAAFLGLMALEGHPGRAVLGDPSQLLRSRRPAVERGLVELPPTVLPGLRVPFDGPFLARSPPDVTLALMRLLDSDPLVVIELRGTDLCDASDDLPAPLLERHRELRIPLAQRLDRLQLVLTALLRDRTGVTLEQAARQLRPDISVDSETKKSSTT